MEMTLSSSHCLVLLMTFLFCSGTLVQATNRILYNLHFSESLPERDVITPTTTIPVVNPSTNPNTGSTNPTVTTNPTPSYPSYTAPTTPTTMTPVTTPYTTPTTPTMTPVTTPYTTPTTPTMTPGTTPYTTPATPTMTPVTTPYTTPTSTTPSTSTGSSGGQSWCIASQSASQTALQVALDYACGYGGADCSAIQQGGSCFNPDTVRDHASYAFNNYYQKNPVPTSCDFGGVAVLTSVDPSTGGSCQFASTSTSSSVLNTSNPIGSGSTVYGSEPPPSYSGTSTQNCVTLIVGFMSFIISCVSLNQT